MRMVTKMSVVDIEYKINQEDKDYEIAYVEKNGKKLMEVKVKKEKIKPLPARIITDKISANEIESWGY